MSTYNINENDIIDIISMIDQPEFSIKPVSNQLENNCFVFYKIRLAKSVKTEMLNKKKDAKWVTIDKMKGLPEAMGSNLDVINMLESRKGMLIDSFEDGVDSIHIIWNITQQCDYNCSICATCDSNRKELDAREKLQVFNSICSAKNKIDILL